MLQYTSKTTCPSPVSQTDSCQPRRDRHQERRVETGAACGAGAGTGLERGRELRAQLLTPDTRPPPPPAWGKGRFAKVCVRVCVCACVQQGRERWCSSTSKLLVCDGETETEGAQCRYDYCEYTTGATIDRRDLTSHQHTCIQQPPPLHRISPQQSKGQGGVPNACTKPGGVRLVNCAMGRESGGSVWWGRQRARPGAEWQSWWAHGDDDGSVSSAGGCQTPRPSSLCND
jgi:hypothetical protein